MRVLVTGSEGFIGRHTVEALRRRGDDVVGVDRKTGTDLVDAKLDIDPPDAVIHLAASCSTPASLRDPLTTFRDTVLTAVNVLEHVRAWRVPVIVTSSVKARDGLTPYGAAKRMVEAWAREHGRHNPVVINRPGTIYGPGQEGSSDSGWIAWMLEAKRTGATFLVNGDGNQQRDLLHVADYVRLQLKQLDEIDRYAGGIYDVGGGIANTVTVHQMLEWLKVPHEHGPARDGDADRYVGLNNVPGWRPEIAWWDHL